MCRNLCRKRDLSVPCKFKNDFSYFEMPAWHRDELIERNQFYARKAKEVVFSQFTEQETSDEADRKENEILEAICEGTYVGNYFNDGDGPPHESVLRYAIMSDMCESMRAGIVAGLFHEWDKSLRKWLSERVATSSGSKKIRKKIWIGKFSEIIELLENLGWSIRDERFYAKIDACRWVVNMHKHGDGNCLMKLKEKYPEYLKSSNDDIHMGAFWYDSFTGRDCLVVNETHIDEFTEAFTQFWLSFPEYREP